MNNFRGRVLQMIFLFCLVPSLCWASQRLETDFADIRQVGTVNLRLLGSALKVFLKFRVCSVGLYLAEGTPTENILKDTPKRLEVIYFLSIPQVELSRATTDGIRRNADKAMFLKLRPKIERMNAAYDDVKPGDKITVTYIPGEGTSVMLNDRFRGKIEGRDFARAFFSIWVGKVPVDRKVKAALLGQAGSTPIIQD